MRRYGDALAMDVGILLTASDLEIETMSYIRVIPRDLFNEGDLLKCYGKVYIELEKLNVDAELEEGEDTDQGFRIEQSQDDGSISIVNVQLVVRGEGYRLSRPLNSRQPYPLYLNTEDDAIAVFTADGRFTNDMCSFLRGDASDV